jgi:hypothetical protein
MKYRDLTEEGWKKYFKVFWITQLIFLVIFAIVMVTT